MQDSGRAGRVQRTLRTSFVAQPAWPPPFPTSRAPWLPSRNAAAIAQRSGWGPPPFPWDKYSLAAWKLRARNVAILGVAAGRPVDAVVTWSEAGPVAGGTGLTIRRPADRGRGAAMPGSTCRRPTAGGYRHTQGNHPP